ncbi:MAG TPA: hypothetical protein VGN93_25980 [Shinella sp.]|jgi:hypothetical protein|uniref:hypothetical protein n=1 Tax=Shinella sp. TaxID=1870904 RepID=UPI002E0D682E|nr:hypothetical protein [Shinella sp.]
MAWLAVVLLFITSIAMLVSGLWRRGGFFGFPFLAAAMFLTFVLPQIPGLIDDRFLPQNSALARAVFFSWLCLVMCSVGWWLGKHSKLGPDLVFSEKRLLYYAAGLSLVGAYFFYRFGQLADEERLRGFLTGTAVAYLFFAKLLTYGLAIALLCFARRRSTLALCIVLFGLAFYFDRIVIAGRRSEAAELGLMVALAFWFHRGWAVPRSLVSLSLVFAMAGLVSVGEYRAATYYNGAPDWRAVLEINPVENWQKLLKQGGPEFRNLVFSMASISENQAYDFGISHWNSVVFVYVPAQLVGSKIKESLYIDTPSVYSRDYDPAPGTTPTGMMDSFASFSYFGCLKFALMAGILSWIYFCAMQGNTSMRLLYMLSATPAMLAITHFTNEIVIAWVHMAVFLIPGLLYAGMRPARRHRDNLNDGGLPRGAPQSVA